MSLTPGAKLGSYKILAAIGAGGMGEVYRARDTKLGREVALKVLPEAFASDRERMARLRREAQVLASLNHPNIASIYGFEDSGATHALVMELVEGPTLAERVKQGATPLDEALPIAKQICEALEYAHERGIIHRDLKPSNIKISSDDAVKVLDFGLAKAIEGDASATSVENSPTLSAMATRAGFLLGTAAYMSPEQARGKDADRRSDIWAFGVVLFEMLSGKRLFSGETTSDTLAAVIRAEPEWGALPANIPPRIRDLLRRCLQKDPRQRFQSIGDARIAIEEVLSGAPEAVASSSAPSSARATWQHAFPWAFSGLLLVTTILFAFGYVLRAPHPASAVVAQIAPPPDTSFALGGPANGLPALSPDGTQLALVALGSDGNQELWVRPLNSSTARPLEETEGANNAFWSPDSRSIGFFAKGELNRIDSSGGPPIAIAAGSRSPGGSWGSDGTILFAPGASEVMRVPASGGTPQQVMKMNESEEAVSWPQFLPDGKHFLTYVLSEEVENSGTYLGSLGGDAPKLILRGDSDAVYAWPGYLLFVRDGTLMAQRFDVSGFRLTGEAMPLAENVAVSNISKRGLFNISENGTLVYMEQSGVSTTGRILWYDRGGKQTAETGKPGSFDMPSLSPNGDKLALAIPDASDKLDIWVYDLVRGIRTRVTFSGASNFAPFWSPDGEIIGFASNRGGPTFHIYEKAADGTGNATPLVVDNGQELMASWSADGRYVIFPRGPGPANGEIWAMPLFGNRKEFPVVQNPQFPSIQPALSPDGKWLAYVSPESGRWEVYIVPFPHGSGKFQISTAGGTWPRWRRDGKELFYIALDKKIMSAEITEQGAALLIGKVRPLFQVNPLSSLFATYDVSADGKKFVVASQGTQQAAAPLTLVTNWQALLKK
jgi:eukaryotic-like serine/threonine-protein kinase